MTCAVGAGWSCALVHTHACAIVVFWPVFWRCWGRLHLGFCAARAVVCHPFVGTGGVRVAALRTVRTGERKAAASKLQAQSLCCGTAGVLAVRRTCWSWWREGGGIEKGKAGGREVRTQLYFQLCNRHTKSAITDRRRRSSRCRKIRGSGRRTGWRSRSTRPT